MKLALLFTVCCGASAGIIITPLLQVGDGVITKCKAGTYMPPALQGECLECAAGYGSSDGASACNRCPRGHMSVKVPKLNPNQPEFGRVCKPCPGGSYAASDGSSTCTKCPARTASAVVGATSAKTCVPCDYQPRQGFTKAGSSVCLPKPK